MHRSRVLVTGAAGFIGFHLARRLLAQGRPVVSIDVVNDYYSVALKEDRLRLLRQFPEFSFHRVDLADRGAVEEVFAQERLDDSVPVVHLAAQAGVRYGLKNPAAFVQSNLVGSFNLLEACRAAGTPHLLFASSSSVYGGNKRLPFSVHDNVDHPISIYAATKKSNELMAHVYAYTYGLPTTGLRFFTVYGPWGRPDMALFLFTEAILHGRPLRVFNYGKMWRDFTYVDDIVEGIVRLIERAPSPDPAWDGLNPDPGTSWVPYRTYNIGNHQAVPLLEFIGVIEQALGRKAELELCPIEVGDVAATYADIDDLQRDVGFVPRTSIGEGIPKFIEWYLDYYGKRRDHPQ